MRLDVDWSQLVDYDNVDFNQGCNSERESFDVNAAHGCCGNVEDTAREWHCRRGDNIVDHRRRVKLVNYVPPAWGSPARDAHCSGMPPLTQAGDGPPSSEGC